jgi:DNA-binding response OmpR family regulator
MPGESVLLYNLTSEESHTVQQLLSQFEVEIPSSIVSGIEEVESLLAEEGARLLIIRADESMARPDQVIRRLKRAPAHKFPLLVLVPQDQTQKVRHYLHAGADDYWVLPLDDASFAPRLYVMLEWGQAVRRGDGERARQRTSLTAGNGSLWSLIRRGIRKAFHSRHLGANPEVESSPSFGGKWERVRRLGFGSFGEVWLVRNKEDELAVAKIPHSKKMNMKFMREAAILKRFADHPNAVQLKEIVKSDEKVILIQEYVEGATLQEFFDRGMDSALKERAFHELLDVVAHAHRHKIMHRDIKPENIIITPSGSVKLLDFGTGKDLTRRSISNTMIGSRPYMAPEQIMGKSRIAGDVWALGVILYALATECLPFYDDNEKQLMDIILEQNPEKPRNIAPQLPEKLEEIILKCLEKDWTKRYRDASELQVELLRTFPDFGEGEVLP